MVPVVDKNKIPLMSCTEKRARLLMERGQAEVYWQKGIFCIRLLKNPSARKFQKVALGIDPGSKREGYTVLTKKQVVFNITSNTPNWVKDHVKSRRDLRRSRRQRKTPYRKCRPNRACLKQARVPPSTKARWDAKLRVVKLLTKILPISIINIEDIKATTKEGEKMKQWNCSFSLLEVGKQYFEKQIARLYPHIKLIKTEGFDTKKHREQRGFVKNKSNKLQYKWETHNVDSHSLAEIALQENVVTHKNMYKLEFMQFHRRQLHVQNPAKNGIRKPYGTTVSEEMPRGLIVKYKGKFAYIGGSSKGKVAMHSIATGKRIYQFAKLTDIEKKLYKTSWRLQFLSCLKESKIPARSA